jgi:hypothetical protein
VKLSELAALAEAVAPPGWALIGVRRAPMHWGIDWRTDHPGTGLAFICVSLDDQMPAEHMATAVAFQTKAARKTVADRAAGIPGIGQLLRDGQIVTGVDRQKKTVRLSGGATLTFEEVARA